MIQLQPGFLCSGVSWGIMIHGASPNEAVRKAAQSVEEGFGEGQRNPASSFNQVVGRGSSLASV